MTPPRLVQARSAAEAVALLRAHAPHARPIAFGGDLLGLWKEGVLDRPGDAPVWVDLAGAPELVRSEATPDGGWRLGAMATLQQLQRVPGIAPLLAEAAARIASPQLRVRTTLGGNLLQRPRCWTFRHPDISCFKKGGSGCPAIGGPPEAHPGAIGGAGPCHAAHPSDLATALLALDARAEIAGPGGQRQLSMAAFYRGAAAQREREAQIAPDEVLVALHVPPQPATQAFEKIAPRAANEFASASAAALVRVTAGRIDGARVALGGVAVEPLLCAQAPDLLMGQTPQQVDVAQAARQLAPFDRVTPGTHGRVVACTVAIERALGRVLAKAAPT